MPGSLWQVSCKESCESPALADSITTDVLVIGGGFTGCSAALELARGGTDVCVLEANAIGHGGSGRNVGLVNAGLWLPPDKIVAALGQNIAEHLIDALAQGPQTVFDVIEREGIDCEATRNGTLHLADTAFGRKELQDRFEQGTRYGAPLKLLNKDECSRRVGTNRYDMALFDPRAGTVQPLAYCRGLARAAAQSGARVFQQSEVRTLQRENGKWIATCTNGRVQARAVLLATNAYSQSTDLGFQPEFVPIFYHQAATTPLPAALRDTILPGGEGCWDAAMVMSSLRLDQSGRLIIGAMGNLEGRFSGSHRLWLRRLIADLFPDLAQTEFEYEWCGQIAMTTDHLPKVVKFGPDALAIFGYSGRGIAPGTLFGRAAARWFNDADDAHLLMPAVTSHTETLTSLRAQSYESGSALVHATLPPGVRRKTFL